MRYLVLFCAVIVASLCRKVLYIEELEGLVNSEDKKLLKNLIADRDMIRSEKSKQLDEILERQTEEIKKKYAEIVAKKKAEEHEKLKKEIQQAKRLGYYDLLSQRETIENDKSISENTADKLEKEFVEKLSPERRKDYYSLKGQTSSTLALRSLIEIVVYLYLIY